MKVAFSILLTLVLCWNVAAWNLFGSDREDAHEEQQQQHQLYSVRDAAKQFAEVVTESIDEHVAHLRNNAKNLYRRLPFDEAYFNDFHVQTRDDEYFLHLDVPGVKKADVRVYVDDPSIHVEAKHECPKKHSILPWIEDERTCVERNYDSIAHFPRDAEVDRLQVVFRDNVVKIRVPRHKENKQSRALQDKWEELKDQTSNRWTEMKDGAEEILDDVKHKADELFGDKMNCITLTATNVIARDAKEL
jgi:HSP20 family molecular chaperone IbpA